MEWLFYGGIVLLVIWLLGKLGSNEAGTDKPAPTVRKAQSGSEAAKARAINAWEGDLTTIWAGDCPPITFTYNGDRRTVEPVEILYNPESCRVYIKGHCRLRDDKRTFSLSKLETMILMKSKRYDPYDWLVKVVGEDVIFHLDITD